MQTLESIPDVKRPSTYKIIRNSITQSGLRGLYAGLSASLLRQMSYSLVRLGAYEKMKEKLSKEGKSSPTRILLAACLAGALGGVAGNPAGVFLQLMSILCLMGIQTSCWFE
jgi:dicarboxylate transporter 10